jgi:hypothetical protein
MRVEVLYVAECPSHPAAVKLVRDVLNSEGVAAEVREVLVRDDSMATDLAFSGSPTIRINGRDIAGESFHGKAFGLSCRLYPGSVKIGLLPLTWCGAPSSRPGRGTCLETRRRHFGIAGCDSEFRRNDQLLSPARICCRSRSRCGKRLLHDTASVALGPFRCFAGPGILAAASRQPVLDPWPTDRECAALDGPCRGRGNDSISAGNRGVHCSAMRTRQ